MLYLVETEAFYENTIAGVYSTLDRAEQAMAELLDTACDRARLYSVELDGPVFSWKHLKTKEAPRERVCRVEGG